MTDSEWMDRYPGTWKGIQLMRSAPCLVCGNPGYIVAAPADLMVYTAEPEPDLTADTLRMHTESTCPGHEWIVRRYLMEHFAPRLMAYREGRP